MRGPRCLGCYESFVADPRSYYSIGKKRRSRQRYCSEDECQKKSHQSSNQAHRKKDPGVRVRNALASRAWRGKSENQDYWKKRRKNNRAYTDRNRMLQRERDRRGSKDLANTDAIKRLRGEKLSRIGVLLHLANTDSRRVSWNLISEEMWLYLKWEMVLANTNPIAKPVINEPQSPS
jgi:hypothetical protein